jgi:hypothetical protein
MFFSSRFEFQNCNTKKVIEIIALRNLDSYESISNKRLQQFLAIVLLTDLEKIKYPQQRTKLKNKLIC